MRVGVGLPATIPGTPGVTVIAWAREADAGPFSNLSVLDRVTYDNYEPMTVLAAAAAVTERIGLAATIVIAPLRRPVMLAKQAATVNALSNGRLTLGVGLGARQDDYLEVGAPYRSRGRDLTDGILEMRRVWDKSEIGPHASGAPRLLVGGGGGLGLSRMARFADGYVHNGGPPRAFLRAATEARAAWNDAGRPGRPALWGMAYVGFADPERGRAYLKDYYAFTGAFADRIAAGLLTSREEIVEFVEGYREAGCDELILFPTIADLAELDRLAGVLT